MREGEHEALPKWGNLMCSCLSFSFFLPIFSFLFHSILINLFASVTFCPLFTCLSPISCPPSLN